jgi:hypothetical protein
MLLVDGLSLLPSIFNLLVHVEVNSRALSVKSLTPVL